MKFQMAKNSLFSILLRKPWWISLLIAVVLGLLGTALLPETMRAVGPLTGAPFAVIAVIAAVRQRGLPNAARIEATQAAVAAMAWPAFASLLEQAFVRDGYTVQRGQMPAVDFVLERHGRRMVVSARRWKSAHTGLEVLRLLQAARDAAEASDALCIGLGAISENAKPFAAEQRIAVWQAAEIAYALRGLPLPAPPSRR